MAAPEDEAAQASVGQGEALPEQIDYMLDLRIYSSDMTTDRKSVV